MKQLKWMKRSCAGLLLLLVFLGLSTSLQSQGTTTGDTAPSVPGANTSAADAPVVNETVLNRIADLEAYINNTGAKKLVNVPGPGHNAFMMICAALGAFHDFAWLGAVLWWTGSQQERLVGSGSMLG